MRPDMHTCCVEIAKPGRTFFCLTANKIFRGSQEFLIYCFHTFGVERAGIFDNLLANFSELWINGCIVLIGCLTFQHSARAKFFTEVWVFRIIWILGFFFGVQVIKISEELIESMNSR